MMTLFGVSMNSAVITRSSESDGSASFAFNFGACRAAENGRVFESVPESEEPSSRGCVPELRSPPPPRFSLFRLSGGNRTVCLGRCIRHDVIRNHTEKHPGTQDQTSYFLPHKFSPSPKRGILLIFSDGCIP